ncbi:DUF402 domain-containing protein [Haloarchaeobius sp. HRN-SO-5]|uniref:DUF402 domain-containing protein n=1 Tax=Haloarchaeobius sp. HRN-SO-5 TaxID=3446118 RepID=UPI003EB9407B
MTVRVRGIYTTALTRLLLDEGFEVAQASPPIRRRFEDDEVDLSARPAAVAVETTRDRQGVGIVGDGDAVQRVRDACTSVAVDALSWTDPAGRGTVADGVVTETLGSGAVVDCGPFEGFLPYDATDGYVDDGDVLRVQVTDPTPPWEGDRPELTTDLVVHGGLVELSRGRSGVSADVRDERATELVRTTDLLSATVPDGWGVRWQRAATDADVGALGDALAAAVERAETLDEAAGGADDARADEAPAPVAEGEATAWVWFGRESRFALDEVRRDVETTMYGHHRVKAATRSASTAVDFVEGVCEDPGGDSFPFAAVSEGFGPREGDRISLGHGKPEGRLLVLGRGTVTELDPEAGTLTVERSMTGGGTYDALGVPRESGDTAVTKLKEGRWWYPTVYRDEDGVSKGTYVNVCTPVELFPDVARYVDLHVDVVRHADGTVERVDDDELDEAVDAGYVPEALAKKARDVATAVERALE